MDHKTATRVLKIIPERSVAGPYEFAHHKEGRIFSHIVVSRIGLPIFAPSLLPAKIHRKSEEYLR